MSLFDVMRDNQSVWRGIHANLKAKLDDLHRMLEKPQDEVETANIRGRIKQIRLIIDEVEGPKASLPGQSKTKPLPSIY